MSEAREPHLFDDATAEELVAFARDDLQDYAQILGVPKSQSKQMNRGRLVAHIIKLRTEQLQPSQTDRSIPGDGTDDTADEEGENEDQITPDEARRMDGATDEVILDWLGKHPDARQCLIDYANLVLSRRVEIRRAEEARQALLSQQPKQFEVTKGAYVATGHGGLTMLAKGSVVSDVTHDLAMLRLHGVELRPVRSVVTETDALGVPHTRVVG